MHSKSSELYTSPKTSSGRKDSSKSNGDGGEGGPDDDEAAKQASSFLSFRLSEPIMYPTDLGQVKAVCPPKLLSQMPAPSTVKKKACGDSE
uniref:Uncharacterized protein n=1 Tax=Romanomermis culicivorax TaxID=13658 RepID=A0A915IBI6_ROMCU